MQMTLGHCRWIKRSVWLLQFEWRFFRFHRHYLLLPSLRNIIWLLQKRIHIHTSLRQMVSLNAAPVNGLIFVLSRLIVVLPSVPFFTTNHLLYQLLSLVLSLTLPLFPHAFLRLARHLLPFDRRLPLPLTGHHPYRRSLRRISSCQVPHQPFRAAWRLIPSLRWRLLEGWPLLKGTSGWHVLPCCLLMHGVSTDRIVLVIR